MAFSRVKTVVHPDYARFEEFVRRLPQEDFPIDRVFCDRRNTVIATHDQGVPMVVKKYARPTLFNCFVYTFFRPSKAQRAYRYALRLARCGVETAAPIGYVHIYRRGIFHTGYFLCRFLPYPTLADAKELDEDEKRQLGEDFIAFTVSLHRHRLLPGDYNPGNILYHKDPDGNTASLWWTSIGFTSGKQPCRTACARSHSSPVSAFHNWPPLSAGIATFVVGT